MSLYVLGVGMSLKGSSAHGPFEGLVVILQQVRVGKDGRNDFEAMYGEEDC